MLGFLKKKSQDDDGPTTNLNRVSRWIQELPAGDIYSAQEKVVQMLIQFNHSEKGFDKDRLQVLMLLDEQMREMQSSLCQQYLRNARMSKSIESRLWMAIHAFYWETTRSYHSFLMDFVTNPGGSKIQSFIPQITARAIRGFSDIIKWRYFRYEKLDEKLWLRLHNLYRIAEFDNFADTPVMVYKGDSRQHSPAEEYSQALLLSPFGNGNLSPREIEMVDQWLDDWSNHVKLDNHYDAEIHSFYIDTSKGIGLRRYRKHGTEPTLRFLSTTALLAHIEEVRKSLKKGSTPASLGLTEGFRLPEGYNLLNQVESEWSAMNQRDRRRSPRMPQSGRWKIIHGLLSIYEEIARSEQQINQVKLTPEEILDIKLYGFVTERTKERVNAVQRANKVETKHEIWEQNDISDNGIGFLIGQTHSEWVKVGRLLAISPADSSEWTLGIVSRLIRQDEGKRLIGVRQLQCDFEPVSLRQEAAELGLSYIVDEMDSFSNDQDSLSILLIDADGKEQLILDGASYSRDRKYVMRLAKSETRVIRLESVVESGEGWLLINFSVVAV